ncbi:MAG TPA: PQQ-dependent sugar dehydrogenase [Tepidisphaeraceae bacterium]|nr:PQQ-dependent sugar dehydrogenase [Tepidisphaeraceae bacterium]
MRRVVVVLALLAGVAMVSSPVCAQRVPEQLKTQDYTVKVETWIDSGLRNPWGIAFIDENTALVTEKGGNVRFIRDGRLEEPIAGTPVSIDIGQGGMMAVSVDPEYATNGWVYLGYTHGRDGTDERRQPTMTRIVRGKIVDNRWTDEQVLFEAKPEHYRTGGVHFGVRIVFDKDGHLYFAIGDRGAQDQAQRLDVPNGKSHRIHRDGSIPADNPYAGRDDAYPSIYSHGNRNIQGMAIHPDTDQLYATEHGPRGGDELNLILPGRNYGWPVITYGINYNGSKITDLTEKEGMEQPIRQWTPSLAVCGLDFYTGSEFPRWQNQLLVGSLAFQELRRVKVDGDKLVEEELLLKGAGRIRDVKVGPDGAIYLVLNSPDIILRLTAQ